MRMDIKLHQTTWLQYWTSSLIHVATTCPGKKGGKFNVLFCDRTNSKLPFIYTAQGELNLWPGEDVNNFGQHKSYRQQRNKPENSKFPVFRTLTQQRAPSAGVRGARTPWQSPWAGWQCWWLAYKGPARAPCKQIEILTAVSGKKTILIDHWL